VDPDADPDTIIFVIDLQEANKILIFLQSFYAYYVLKVHLHHFSKIKRPKEVTKQKESRFFLLFLLDDRRIRIWIPNPDPYLSLVNPDPGLGSLNPVPDMDVGFCPDPDPDPVPRVHREQKLQICTVKNSDFGLKSTTVCTRSLIFCSFVLCCLAFRLNSE
jgi:hypothetical protein